MLTITHARREGPTVKGKTAAAGAAGVSQETLFNEFAGLLERIAEALVASQQGCGESHAAPPPITRDGSPRPSAEGKALSSTTGQGAVERPQVASTEQESREVCAPEQEEAGETEQDSDEVVDGDSHTPTQEHAAAVDAGAVEQVAAQVIPERTICQQSEATCSRELSTVTEQGAGDEAEAPQEEVPEEVAAAASTQLQSTTANSTKEASQHSVQATQVAQAHSSEGDVSEQDKGTIEEKHTEDPFVEGVAKVFERAERVSGELDDQPQSRGRGAESPASSPLAQAVGVLGNAAGTELRGSPAQGTTQGAARSREIDLITAKLGEAKGVLAHLNSGSGANGPQRGASEELRTKPLTRLQSANTFERVEKALKEVSRSRDGKTISVRLDPPELGSVKIDVSLRDGALHARIVTESSQVNLMLKERAHELQQLLRKLGVDAQSVAVSVVSDEGTSGNSAFFASERESSRNEQERSEARSESTVVEGGGTGIVDSSAIIDHWVA